MGNNNGTLPLHWAAAKNSNTNVINSLLRAYPSAIRMPDHEGSLPLHSAGQNKYLHIVKVIYDAFPEAIAMPDSEGGVPLHHACCFNSNLDVVKFMHDAYPDGIRLAQSNGIMPIHLAASQNPSADVMRFILSNCPESAFAVDNHGWLPLHCLIENDPLDMTASRIESLRMLLRAHPRAVVHKNMSGISALDHARLRRHRDYVVRLMLLACPEADPVELARLNWNSQRRLALLTFLSLESRTAEALSGETNTVYDINNREMGTLVLLSRGAFSVSGSGYSLMSSVVRHIIKFL
jgi:ankyrin repeat protein